MTITLDDVASILHIPITGSMISFSQPLRVDDANALLVKLLGTTDVEASRETEQCRSPSVRILWLRDNFRLLRMSHLMMISSLLLEPSCSIWLVALYLLIRVHLVS